MVLATASLCDLGVGPYEGKETGETASLRGLAETFYKNTVVFDGYYCSFMIPALLSRIHIPVRTETLLIYGRQRDMIL